MFIWFYQKNSNEGFCTLVTGEVVYDSIIQNKSKIKSYWEQLMIAAELASQHAVPKNLQQQQTTPAASEAPPPSTHNEKVHSPDLSEAEFYDALSHISAVQVSQVFNKMG